MVVGGKPHAPAALPTRKTRCPLYRRLGGPQGRSGRVRKISPPTEIRSPDRPARTESLCRLSYRGLQFTDVKGKAVPLQAWSGPEGSRKLRFPDFMTTAQEGGKVVILTHRPHLAQEILLVLISVRG